MANGALDPTGILQDLQQDRQNGLASLLALGRTLLPDDLRPQGDAGVAHNSDANLTSLVQEVRNGRTGQRGSADNLDRAVNLAAGYCALAEEVQRIDGSIKEDQDGVGRFERLHQRVARLQSDNDAVRDRLLGAHTVMTAASTASPDATHPATASSL